MPKLWNETIEAHRQGVREAILSTTAELVAEHGLRAVTMSRIAEDVGIGRATLYKYFSDVEAILRAWHDRQLTGHLEYLTAVRDRGSDAVDRLTAVLEGYAHIAHRRGRHGELEFLHGTEHVAHAQRQLHRMLRELLAEAVANGDVRDDVTPEELASFCLHALDAAGSLPSEAAARRLVTITLDGLGACVER